MTRNDELLQQLFDAELIRIRRSRLFDQHVQPKGPRFDFDKVEGMMLGLAIGDALGITTEGMLPAERRATHGELRDYIPNKYVNAPIGFPSDDTQLAFWTLEQMIADRGFVPENVAGRFCQDRIFGIGSTVRRFIANFKSGMPWHKCGPESAGNGALMRIAPMVVPHLAADGTGIWTDTALSAMLTHNDSSSIAACLAFVAMLWELLDMAEAPESEWWLQRYVSIARDLEISQYAPRGGAFLAYHGPLWRYCQERVAWADSQFLTVLDACNQWHSGAYLMETVPSVLMILTRHGHDPEEAIVRAVNDTKDNDTVAAIVGAAVGALHGRRGLPQRWIQNLSGRTTDRDDGRVFELLKTARMTFWG